MKKAVIFLLILAMVLPMCLIANAAAKPGSKLPTPYTLKVAGASYKLVNYDIPIYLINEPKQTQDKEGNPFTKVGQTMIGANEDNYNAKLIWNHTDDRPSLILRGFVFDEWNNETGLMEGKADANSETGYKKLQTYSINTGASAPLDVILTGGDSMIEAMFGITFYNDLTITSDGATKLIMNNEASCIAPNQSAGSLTINANLDLTLGRFYNTQYASAVIHTYGGDLTINGGHLDLKCNTAETKVLTAIHARNGANLTINGGVINAMSIIGTARNNGCIRAEGKLTINGGYITALPKDALGLHGKAGIEMNGGIVNTTARLWAISFGASKDDPQQFVFNGGTLTATSKRVFHDECRNILLGAGVTVYAGTDEANAKVYDGAETKYANQSWVRFTNNPNHAPGWDGKDSAAATLPSTKPTIAPSTAATQVPTTAPATVPATVPTIAPTTVPTMAPATAATVATIPVTQATLAPTVATAEVTRVTVPHLTVPTRVTAATMPTQSVMTVPVQTQPVETLPAETQPVATRPAQTAATRFTRPVEIVTRPTVNVTTPTGTVALPAQTQPVATQAPNVTDATQLPGETEAPLATDATQAPDVTQAPGITAATITPGVTGITLAPTEATEVTVATEATEVTEQTQPTEATESETQDKEQDEEKGPGATQIVLITVAVLAVAGGGTAVWYFCIYKKKPSVPAEETEKTEE